MSTPNQAKKRGGLTRMLAGGGVLLAIAGGYYWLKGGGADSGELAATFEARRGPLDITVLEGGSINAMESQEIRSSVEGREGVKILSIVSEGYLVTEEDVKNELVLVELDKSSLEDQFVNQEIQFQSAQSRYIEAQAEFDIQVNQNRSLINKASLEMKFALIDLQKFLGEKAVGDIVTSLELDKRAAEVMKAGELLQSRSTTADLAALSSDASTPAPLITPAIPGEENTDGPPRGPRNGEGRRLRENGGDPNGGDRPEGSGGFGGRRGGGAAPSTDAAGGSGGFGGRRGGDGTGGAGGGGNPVATADAGGPPAAGDTDGVRPQWGGNGGAPPPGFDPNEGIPMDDELIDAIGAEMAKAGMPVEPERFKEMMKSRAPGGVPRLNSFMAERMKEMGIDVMEIAKRLGKMDGAPAAATPEPVDIKVEMDSAYTEKRAALDFTKYADEEQLEDGEAKQALRKLDDDLLVSQEDFQLAKNDFESTERLAERDFMTQTELDRQRVNVNKTEIRVSSAEAGKRLYIKYIFPKEVEKLLSAYEESLLSMERTWTEAHAKLLQANAKLKSAESQFRIEKEKLDDFARQIEACVIRATTQGLVVYGTSTEENMFRRNNEEPIGEGATVRERQLIITIPDMTQMSTKVNIHESSVKRVVKTQKARIRIDAFPGEALEGEVLRVAVLPDSGNRWMNPDVKVYPVEVQLSGAHEWLRPGMSAQVEILVGRLEDVVQIPIQAVLTEGGSRYCYMAGGSKPEKRLIETGE
ncbi:MAG: HlyD family efflux transporter periplasmic adaptor subunit, partial [Candidatus Hydrogenedentota bacterium]